MLEPLTKVVENLSSESKIEPNPNIPATADFEIEVYTKSAKVSLLEKLIKLGRIEWLAASLSQQAFEFSLAQASTRTSMFGVGLSGSWTGDPRPFCIAAGCHEGHT